MNTTLKSTVVVGETLVTTSNTKKLNAAHIK